MDELIAKYTEKLVKSKLVEEENILFGGLNEKIFWNNINSPYLPVLSKVLESLNINSVLYAKPKEPFSSILNYYSDSGINIIKPEDTETRTFLHDIPVIQEYSAESVIFALKKRKSVIVNKNAIVTWGNVSPEQAFVTYSSVCFSLFVKFFLDYLFHLYNRTASANEIILFEKLKKYISPVENTESLIKDPLKKEEIIYRAMCEVGRKTVFNGLVDSYFGNISILYDDNIYITQSGSSLDELEGLIDKVPLDGSSSAGLTSSSEFSAHKGVYGVSEKSLILHGHPKFSVIMSMFCKKKGKCANSEFCHIKCSEERIVCGTKVITGEVGRGKYGLWKTLPDALKNSNSAIVFGHGVFTTGSDDFNLPFSIMCELENRCMKSYFDLVTELTSVHG